MQFFTEFHTSMFANLSTELCNDSVHSSAMNIIITALAMCVCTATHRIMCCVSVTNTWFILFGMYVLWCWSNCVCGVVWKWYAHTHHNCTSTLHTIVVLMWCSCYCRHEWWWDSWLGWWSTRNTHDHMPTPALSQELLIEVHYNVSKLEYSSPLIIRTSIIRTLDYPNLDYPNSSKATFYYEYQDGGSFVALWQL